MSIPFVMPKDPLLELRFLRVRAAQGNAIESALHLETYWARNAIYHALRALGVSPGDQVLVPAYLCTAAVSPILAFGAHVTFYGVGSRCELDFDDLTRRVTRKTKAVLAVHYFGFPQSLSRLVAWCSERGIALIEDCAHVLSGVVDGRAMGSIGDVSVFSWRKFLPLYSGGELVLNRESQSFQVDQVPTSLQLLLKDMKTAVERMNRSGRLPIIDRMRDTLRTVTGSHRSAQERQGSVPSAVVHQGDEFDPTLANMPMPQLSRWLRAHSDIDAIVAARRKNYQYLFERFQDMRGVTPLFQELPAAVCPLIFPVAIGNMANAHLLLRNQGIPAVTWGGVRHPSLPYGVFAQADTLYDRLVHLPIHQSLSPVDLDRIAEAVRGMLPQS